MQSICRINVFACILFLIIIASSSRSFAQTDVPIGTGTAANGDWEDPSPLPDRNGSTRAQYLYLGTELAAGGMQPGTIYAIRFNVKELYTDFDPANPNAKVDQLLIKIGSTSTASLDLATWEAGTTPIYGPVDYLPTQGLNSFTLTVPFFWNGSDNIVIEICTDGTLNNSWSRNQHVNWTTGLAFNGSHTMGELFTRMCEETGFSNVGDATARPNIIFNYTQAPICASGTLTGGTAKTNKAAVCMDEPFTLSLTGASVATGLSYQWQSSTDHINWTNVNKGTEAAITTQQPVTTWYRAIVTCSAGGTATSAEVQVITPLPLSGTYTIDKTLPASATNFQTFRDAYNFIKCGINGPVVFNVAAGSGIYNEQLLLYPVPGASATNTITFNGNGNTLEYASTNAKERAVIKFDGADHFVFNELTINATGNYGYGVHLINNADSNTINNCTINTNETAESDNYAGIVVSSSASSPTQLGAALCDGNTFSNNTIIGGKYGITVVGSSSAANGNNKLLNNRITNFATQGIYIACSFSTQVNGNILSRPGRGYTYITYGIYTTNINTRLSISGNTITQLFDGPGHESATAYAIYAESAAALGGLENVVSNNLIYNINGGGTVYGIYNSQSHNTLYYHNTISLDGDGAAVTEPDQYVIGFYMADATGVRFFNNNLYITRTGAATNAALYFNSPVSDLQGDNNNIYVEDGSGFRMTGYLNGKRYRYLNEWQAISGLDAASISADPLFVDPSTGDFTPQNAALDNLGASVGVATDIKGTARNNPPDIGAFEFNPPPCAVPPTAGTTVLKTSGVCVDNTAVISLTGNSSGASQTYQLQSADAVTGPFTNLGNVSSNPVFNIASTVNKYYRVAVTCGANTTYSTPVQLLVYQLLAAGTYTINKNAASSPTNFVSFNAAKDALGCGIAGPVVFNVEPNSGPYDEQLILDTIKGASAINTITFNGNGNTLTFSSNDSEERAVIKLRNADHFIFDSLVIDATGAGTYGFGVQFIANADSNTIRRSTIRTATNIGNDDGFAGIVISNSNSDMYATGYTWCDNNLFEGNTVIGGLAGITIVGDPVVWSGTNYIYDNKVINCKIQDFYERGIYMNGTNRTVIENNIISRPTRTNLGSFNGLYIAETNGSLTVNRNRITNPFGGNPAATQSFYGMYLEMAGDDDPNNYITNNLFYGLNGAGAQYGFYLNSVRNYNFYHNTVALDNAALPGANTSNVYAIYCTNSSGNTAIKNNIFSITRGGGGNKYGFYVGSGDVINFDLAKNDYYIKSAYGNNFQGYRNGNLVTLADWQSATNRDHTSYSIDPVFKEPAAGNYQPTIAPMNDNGDAVGVVKDILNVDRSTTTPDVGAYEFLPTPCLSGVIAGTGVATPNNGICIGTMIELSLTGNTTSGFQTYRWERSMDGTTNWKSIGDTSYVSTLKTEAIGHAYYRAIVFCTGIYDTSTVAEVQVNAPLAGGVYTIGSSAGANYPNFTAAVAALQCGIGGHIFFDVEAGTYNEQVLIKRIPGASDTSRVTFRAANGVATSVDLRFAGTPAANYVLKLDSASYLTFDHISITATDAANARVVELAGTSSYDSLLNNIITSVTTNATATSRAAIFASPFKGESVVIKGNTVNNGASGIYVTATAANRNKGLVVADNIVKGFFQYGIYNTWNSRSSITGNTITIAAAVANNAAGIYSADADSSYIIKHNAVNISNTANTVYGINVLRGNGRQSMPGIVDGNKVIGVTNNTGSLYGVSLNGSFYTTASNNAVSIKASGANSYGIYNNSNTWAKWYNNTVVNSSTTTDNNTAAYFSDSGSDLMKVEASNNIFSNEGDGVALFVSDNWNQLEHLYIDYNMLYAAGGVLVRNGFNGDYSNLLDWQNASDLDLNSIVFKPALTSATDLSPDVNAPEVWAIHGRGNQINGNDHDINDQRRSTSLKAGVPDLGAYEFVPTSVPVAAVATPATPAANTSQVYMMGTDTVAIVNWGASVPSDATLRRYSGMKPNNLPTGKDFMYFYNDFDLTGTGSYTYDMDQRYLDPWRGFIDNEERIRLGRTSNTGEWLIDSASAVDITYNTIKQPALDFMDQFTGLTEPRIPYPSTDSARQDTSNLGVRFWVGYGHNTYIENFTVRMGGGEKDANVTVRVHGTSWVRHYFVPAHTFVISERIPRYGVSGAEILAEGISDRGISVESTEPIAVFTYCDGGFGSATGSTMLLPTSAYGYEYYALTWRQLNIEVGTDYQVHSWFYVIADHDSTMVEITPANPTAGGRAAGVPFAVMLNKGQVYQVLGAIHTQNENYDLTGSHVRTLTNASGNCYPVAVFSGNSDAYIDCSENFVPSGSFIIQQNYPVQGWGKKFLTAPTTRWRTKADPLTSFFRVLVKDPATVVKVNGTALTGLQKGNFYEYRSTTADYIEADAPVQVAQFLPGPSINCDFGYVSDPEMFYLPPMGEGIKKGDMYRTTAASPPIDENYLQVIIPTNGMASLLIDGANQFDSSYVHPNYPGYTVVIKKWAGTETSSSVSSDSMFTALGYGLGSGNSYGYVVGRKIVTSPAKPGITNKYDSTGGFSAFNCVATPFKYSVLLPMVPTKLSWLFSKATPGMQPTADSVFTAPTPSSTEVIDGQMYYRFDLGGEFLFSTPGDYTVPIEFVHPIIDNCSNTTQHLFKVHVVGTPVVDINAVTTGCVGDTVQFSAIVNAQGGDVVRNLHWNFGDNSTSDLLTPGKLYPGAGTYNIKVDAITKVGCFATATEPLELKGPAAVDFVADTVKACPGTGATLATNNPETGVVYNWYETLTGGAVVHTGTSHTINPLTATKTFYVEAVKDGCTTKPRAAVVAQAIPAIATPVVRVDSTGATAIRFAWNAVQGASGYQVSTDNGTTWSTPSSGTNGLTHTVSGLAGGVQVTLLVKALDPNKCADKISTPVSANTLPGDVFVPNAFSPNNDGLNDEFKVEGFSVRSMQLRVFNQWGELIFESNDQNRGWDGRYKGKLQPSGVYMYVCSMTMLDGEKVVKKGAVNLVR